MVGWSTSCTALHPMLSQDVLRTTPERAWKQKRCSSTLSIPSTLSLSRKRGRKKAFFLPRYLPGCRTAATERAMALLRRLPSSPWFRVATMLFSNNFPRTFRFFGSPKPPPGRGGPPAASDDRSRRNPRRSSQQERWASSGPLLFLDFPRTSLLRTSRVDTGSSGDPGPPRPGPPGAPGGLRTAPEGRRERQGGSALRD